MVIYEGERLKNTGCSTRHVTYVVLKLRGSDYTFAVMNVHLDHKSEEAREKSAALLAAKAESLGLPCILCGDFNCAQDSAVRPNEPELFFTTWESLISMFIGYART